MLHIVHTRGLAAGERVAPVFLRLLFRVASSDLLASVASMPICLDFVYTFSHINDMIHTFPAKAY